MNTISVIVITKNSEKSLEVCLNSIRELASEIVLVDDFSTDRTVSIAQKYGVKLFQRKLQTCATQKQYALEQASKEWLFLLDSDEASTPSLIEEIKRIVSSANACVGYRVPRKNIYFGKWLRFGGKYPDYQVRLFRKNSARFSEHVSHEKVMIDGEVGTLANSIEHFAYPDIETWFLKLKRTAEFDALEWERKEIKPSSFNYVRFCLLRPFSRFLRKYVLKLGLLDGLPGLLACLHDLLTQLLTYLILTEKYRIKNNSSINGIKQVKP